MSTSEFWSKRCHLSMAHTYTRRVSFARAESESIRPRCIPCGPSNLLLYQSGRFWCLWPAFPFRVFPFWAGWENSERYQYAGRSNRRKISQNHRQKAQEACSLRLGRGKNHKVLYLNEAIPSPSKRLHFAFSLNCLSFVVAKEIQSFNNVLRVIILFMSNSAGQPRKRQAGRQLLTRRGDEIART